MWRSVAVLLALLARAARAGHVGGLESATAALFDAHPCRFLPPSQCFAQNFDYQPTTRSEFWGDSGLGTTECDDPSQHARAKLWKVRDATLQYSKGDWGALFECASAGTMALVRPASPFLSDNVQLQFDVALELDSPRQGALGFAFRYDSPNNFYRFEWQPDAGCASVVHYEGHYKRRTSTVLASATGHAMLSNQYYHVTIELVAAAIDVTVRGVNRNGLSVQSRDEFSLHAIDPDYKPQSFFTGAFYAGLKLAVRFDNFIMVAHSEIERLGSWSDEPYPNNAVCPTLATDRCVHYDFEERKNLKEVPHEVHLDGATTPEAEYSGWVVTRSDDSKRALFERKGYGVTIEQDRDACMRQYGTYLTLSEVRQIHSAELIISFRMKVTDNHAGGIGVMLRLQNALPGFRPTPSYYRYSWGEAPSTRTPCESLLYHNGAKGRFESVSSEPSELAAPEKLSSGWHRVEIFLSNDQIVVTRNGVLVGQPIYKPNGAPSLRLSYGDVALFCGGHGGGSDDMCAFDDILVVDAAYAREAVVWDSKQLKADDIPPMRPVSDAAIYSLDHALWDNTRWEGEREWTVAYTRDRQRQCAPKGVTYKQKVAFEFFDDGRFTIFAHQVTLGTEPDTHRRDDEKEQWYVFAENRIAYVARDYEGHREWPRLYYTHPDSDTTHCLVFKVHDDDPNKASVAWAVDDQSCSSPPIACGYTAELTRLGELSREYPPTLRITDPPPNSHEQWTVGQNQTITLRASNAHSFKARVLVKLFSNEVADAEIKLNRDIEFTREDSDQWLTGEVKLFSAIYVADHFLLGNNTLSFELRGVDVVAQVSTSVQIECLVCMAADNGLPASQCAHTCHDPAGCADERCNVGKIHCSHRFAGRDLNHYCLRYRRDRPAMCMPEGGCAPLDAFEYCRFDGQVIKPVMEKHCGSPACEKNCDDGVKVDVETSAFETGDVSLICETQEQTSACRGRARCREGGYCLTNTEAPTPPPPGATGAPTPRPTLAAPPIEETLVSPVCRQCVNGFGEPGSQKWCTCCAYDCNNARQNCVTYNGFCTSRCTEDDNSRYCDWDGAPTRAPPQREAPVLINDEDVRQEAPVESDSSSSSSSSDRHHKSALDKHLQFSTPPPTPRSKADTRPASGDDDSESESESEPLAATEAAPPATAPPTPAPTTKLADARGLLHVVNASDDDDGAEALQGEGAPVTSMTVGSVVLALIVAGIVLVRRFSTQRPVDFDHVA